MGEQVGQAGVTTYIIAVCASVSVASKIERDSRAKNPAGNRVWIESAEYIPDAEPV
jgi:hypothetical protein